MSSNIVFITFYDTIAYGVRLLAEVARQEGLHPHLVHLKAHSRFVPLLRDKDQFESYQYIVNGLLRGGSYAVDPVSPREEQLLLEQLQRLRPRLICLSTRTFAWSLCMRLVPRIRRLLPDVPVLAGGWGPTLEPERFLRCADGVCIGEGEPAMRHLARRMAQGRPWDDAPNLARLVRGERVQNALAPPLDRAAMAQLPLPGYRPEEAILIADDRVRRVERPLWAFDDPSIDGTYYCFCSRGCPMACSYCMAGRLRDIFRRESAHRCPAYRLRDVDDVFAELHNARRLGARVVTFKDEVFPASRRFVGDFLERYPREIGLPFFAYIRPEMHPPHTIQKLREVGLRETTVGIQSGSDAIRRLYGRRLDKSRLIAFASHVRELGIDFHYHFIYRNPLEREHHLRESLAFACQLPYGKTIVFKLALFPGSPLGRKVAQEAPRPLPRRLSHWYALLHCLALAGPAQRRLAQQLHRHRLLLDRPQALALAFAPQLLHGVARTAGFEVGRRVRLLLRQGAGVRGPAAERTS